MANPLFAEARGGVRSPDFRDEDIARFFDSLALELAERLQAAPDSEASLTLLSVMKERPDLCRKYFEFVPIGLHDATPQAAVDVVRSLALMKAGPSADGKYDYQAMIVKDEMSRFSGTRRGRGRMDRVGEVEHTLPLVGDASRDHRAQGGSRSPQRLGQFAIPPLPRITELLYLVRALGGTIPRLADVFREIVETGFREIAERRRVHVDERPVASLHQLPIASANRHHAAEAPIQRVVRRAFRSSGQKRQEVDAVDLRSVRLYARGSKRGRQNVELNGRPVIHAPRVEVPFHDIANATRMPPSQVCRFDPRSGPLLDPLTVVVGIVGPPLSFTKITSVFSSSFCSCRAVSVLPIASSIADTMAA